MNYEEMSDFQINRAVALALGDELYEGLYTKASGDKWVRTKTKRKFDPCNSASDAWPIIVENGISLYDPYTSGTDQDNGEWIADKWHSRKNRSIESYDKNPLRAAMIVFLMMEEAKNEMA